MVGQNMAQSSLKHNWWDRFSLLWSEAQRALHRHAKINVSVVITWLGFSCKFQVPAHPCAGGCPTSWPQAARMGRHVSASLTPNATTNPTITDNNEKASWRRLKRWAGGKQALPYTISQLMDLILLLKDNKSKVWHVRSLTINAWKLRTLQLQSIWIKKYNLHGKSDQFEHKAAQSM